jgi:hypothetical protein
VEAVIRGVGQRQLREISGGNSCFGQSALWANFGLGDATNIDLVSIEWPSGIVQTLTNVAPRQILTVVEQQMISTNRPIFTGISLQVNGGVNLSVTGDTNLLYLFEASTNLSNWTWLAARTNLTGSIQFADPKATNYAERFYRVSVP